MSKDDLKWGRSYVKEEEEERIRQTTINLVKKRALEDGKELGIAEGKELGIAEGKELGIEVGIEQKEQEVIISMHEEGYDIVTISKIVKVPTSKIEQIIEDLSNRTKIIIK